MINTAPAPRPDWFRTLPGAHGRGTRWGWTTADGPDFKSPAEAPAQADAVSRLARAAGLPNAAWVHQVHGGVVLRATHAGYHGEADALWTDEPGLGVVGRSADCPLILVAGADRTGRGLHGFAHASWRSTVARVTASLLAAMSDAGLQAADATATICPSAGPCCYEIGPEVEAAVHAALGPEAADFMTRPGARAHFDLWRANGHQLEAAGLTADRIFNPGVCTICGGTDYPSYRRQGARAGRFAAICGGDADL